MGAKIGSLNNGQICFIYALVDPRSNEVKYIGKTLAPKLRYKAHLNTKAGFANSKKDKWILELLGLGLTPDFKIIEECPEMASQERETFHIRQYIANGASLLNGNAQSIKLDKTTGIDIVLPNRVLYLFEELAKSKKCSREDLMQKVLIDYIDNIDLSKINCDIENYIDYISNN